MGKFHGDFLFARLSCKRDTLFNSLHTKLLPVFTRDEAIPLKQNNETKRCTFEIWVADKEIVN